VFKRNSFKLLIVEDDDAIREGLVDTFVFHGYSVAAAADGEEGLKMALSEGYDLHILDIMLPSRSGFSLCENIRAHAPGAPIIILTAKGAEEDVIQGLTLGADDYITKPFSVRELVLRVNAVLRRTAKWKKLEGIITIGRLAIDLQTLDGWICDEGEQVNKTLNFSRREVLALQYLYANSPRPVSRSELLKEVWGYARSGCFDTRTVDILIAKIRRKIEVNPKEPQLLQTVRGEGYQLVYSQK
jgi:two-component system response regulator RegX3